MKRAAVIVCAVVFLAACGGGGGSATSPEDQIKAAYTSFFSAKGSADAHAALLENGSKFKPVIQQFLLNPQAGDVSATVSKVTLDGADKASVVYSIQVSGFTLSDRIGGAVRQDGKWKVASGTLCGLIALASAPPPVCNG